MPDSKMSPCVTVGILPKRKTTGWGKSRSQETENDSNRHAGCPENVDCRIFADAAPFAHPFHAEDRKSREDGCREQGRNHRIQSDTHPTERSMCDSSADEDQTVGHDVRADNSADDTGKQASQQGISEKVHWKSSSILESSEIWSDEYIAL